MLPIFFFFFFDNTRKIVLLIVRPEFVSVFRTIINASITSYPVSVIVIGSPVNGYAMGTTTAKRAASSSIILSNNTNAKFVHRLPYMYNTSDTTNIEIVKSKVLVAENTENKLLVLNNVYDVSTVPADNKIIIDNKKYFCLDNHTIMEV